MATSLGNWFVPSALLAVCVSRMLFREFALSSQFGSLGFACCGQDVRLLFRCWTLHVCFFQHLRFCAMELICLPGIGSENVGDQSLAATGHARRGRQCSPTWVPAPGYLFTPMYGRVDSVVLTSGMSTTERGMTFRGKITEQHRPPQIAAISGIVEW